MNARQLNPVEVAANMAAIRGRDPAIARCERFISGAIRSEEPRSFWEEVKAALEREAA